MLPPPFEIESIEWLAPATLLEEESHPSGLYLFCHGTWSLTSGSDGSELRIHPGDLLLILSAAALKLEPNLFEPGEHGQAPLLRIRVSQKVFDEVFGDRQLPEFCHLRSLFSPATLSGESADLTKGLASVLFSVVFGTQLEAVLATGAVSGVEPDVAQAILAMQRDPALPWTIERLAREAGVSRSTLAQKFKSQTGQTPNEFLLNLRMRLAEELMRGRKHHLKEIARRTGYQSVSAFSTAFKRWSGSPPSVHRRRAVP